MTSLDVGCGFRKGRQKRGNVGLDVNRGVCDVVGDAENLPFREGVFERLYLHAILEHLDNPMKCLRESVRVAKDGARFEIVIPVETRDWVWHLKHLVFEFPLGILWIVERMWRMTRYRREEDLGGRHKRFVQPHHVSAFLRIKKVEKHKGIHTWFMGRKGKPLRKLLGRVILVDIESYWYIEAIKVEGD
jgi:ubiquinone/menaquinone biosynthesis C-methylase UbiE